MEMLEGRGSDLRGLHASFSAKMAAAGHLFSEQSVTRNDDLPEIFETHVGTRFPRETVLQDLGHDYKGAGAV
jgi:hypothetical protein